MSNSSLPWTIHLLFCDTLPAEVEEEQEVIMIETDEALPPDGIQPEDAFGFVATVVSNYDDVAQLGSDISDWWKSLSDVRPSLELELLASDVPLMTEEAQEVASRLPAGYWNMAGFIGFLKSSPSARIEARKLAVESAIRSAIEPA